MDREWLTQRFGRRNQGYVRGWVGNSRSMPSFLFVEVKDYMSPTFPDTGYVQSFP
jgi:hypothetical protein